HGGIPLAQNAAPTLERTQPLGGNQAIHAGAEENEPHLGMTGRQRIECAEENLEAVLPSRSHGGRHQGPATFAQPANICGRGRGPGAVGNEWLQDLQAVMGDARGLEDTGDGVVGAEDALEAEAGRARELPVGAFLQKRRGQSGVHGQQSTGAVQAKRSSEGESQQPCPRVVAGNVDVERQASDGTNRGGDPGDAAAAKDSILSRSAPTLLARIVDANGDPLLFCQATKRAHVDRDPAPGRRVRPHQGDGLHPCPPPARSGKVSVTPKCFFLSSRTPRRASGEARSGRAGIPPTTWPGSTSCSTTPLAPMMAPSPTTIGPRSVAPGEMRTSSPIHGAPWSPERPPMVTCWPMRQRAPIRDSG